MVRKTGLEPVRLATHAPQTCLSANSSTSAAAKNILSCQAAYVKDEKAAKSKKHCIARQFRTISILYNILPSEKCRTRQGFLLF